MKGRFFYFFLFLLQATLLSWLERFVLRFVKYPAYEKLRAKTDG